MTTSDHSIKESDKQIKLDAIDRRILRHLRDNGRMTNVNLARLSGISAPPCLRRVRALEAAGFIKGYHAELDGEMGDSHMGLQARLMSQALRKLTGTVSRSNTCVLFINQIREKIGIMFGNPETTPGGRALKFYSSQRLEIRRITTIKNGTDPVGNRVRVKVVKNKVAPPFKMAEFDIMYGQGISYIGDVLDLAVTGDIIQKMGAWYAYKDEKIGQGRENTKAFLKENHDLLSDIVKQVKGFMGISFAEDGKA